MRIGPHKHRCDDCQQPTECCGDIEQNWDGYPEWICREYHSIERDVQIRSFLCDACGEKAEAAYAKDIAEQEADEAFTSSLDCCQCRKPIALPTSDPFFCDTCRPRVDAGLKQEAHS